MNGAGDVKKEAQSPPKPRGSGSHTWRSVGLIQGYSLEVRKNQREKESSPLCWANSNEILRSRQDIHVHYEYVGLGSFKKTFCPVPE